jgi:NAD(P)-dependent dehydrogenase (short-subunit alcohol dehydrogenase family)
MSIGGADGFGAAIVDKFSQEGWKVIVIDLNKSGGAAKASVDPNLEYVFGDVSKQETWETALEIIRNKYGRVDVIVNNAGTYTKICSYSELTC